MVTPEKLEAGLSQVRAAAADHGRPAEAVKGAVFAWTCADADGDWARRCGTEMVSRIYRQDFGPLADRYLFLGTPDQLVARLGEYADAGAERVIISVAAGADDRPRVVRTLADQVLAALADL